jgi:hypothetical protein
VDLRRIVMERYENYKLKWEMCSDAIDRKNKQIYELNKEIEQLKINTIPKEFGTGELLSQITELQIELSITEYRLEEEYGKMAKIRELVKDREYSDDTIISLIFNLVYGRS